MNPNKFKTGDRVVVTDKRNGNFGKEGVVVGGSYGLISVEVEGSATHHYYPESLTRVVLVVDERAELVKAVESARAADKAASLAISEAILAQSKSVKLFCKALDALKQYDDAHREPTFVEKLDALGLGAVIEAASDGRKYVKMENGNWQGSGGRYSREGIPSGNFGFEKDGYWNIKSEGVKA